LYLHKSALVSWKSDATMLNTMKLAKKVGLHPVTVARFARENRIPGQFIGGRHGWNFELEAVRAALLEMRANKAQRALSVTKGAK